MTEEERKQCLDVLSDSAKIANKYGPKIIEDSDALYSENTGRRNNPKESAWCANLSLKALAACGYVKVDGDSVEILVRPNRFL